MTRIFISLCLILGVSGCGNRKQDPAPPAGSVVVPVGAPNATGAMAGGRTPSPTPGQIPDTDSEDPEETPPIAPIPVTPLDSGVTL